MLKSYLLMCRVERRYYLIDINLVKFIKEVEISWCKIDNNLLEFEIKIY